MTSQAARFFSAPWRRRLLRSSSHKISLRDADKEQGATVSSYRFIGVIDIDPHEPSVLHLLEDQGSSSTSTPRDVFAIDGTSTSACANAEAENQVVTPAQHIGAINAILREIPYDPVLNDDLARWTERLQESVANLSNAFEEAIAGAQPEQPIAGGADGERPKQRTSPQRATPPPRGTSDLRDHLNGRREAWHARDKKNRSRDRVTSLRRGNKERGGHPSENQDRDNHHSRHERDDREQRVPGDIPTGERRTKILGVLVSRECVKGLYVSILKESGVFVI